MGPPQLNSTPLSWQSLSNKRASIWTVSRFIGLAASLVGGSRAWADSPATIEDVSATQRTDGSMLVDIYYTLVEPDNTPSTIGIEASDDNGVSWSAPITALSGDLGPGIMPGTGKHIVWDSQVDLPGVFWNLFRVRVCVDVEAPSGMAFIPAGEYLMGDHYGRSTVTDDGPVHAVYIDSFFMDVFEVTNQKYVEALNWAWTHGALITVSGDGTVTSFVGNFTYCNNGSDRLTWDGSVFGVVAGYENHPMVNVTWHGAAVYANWRSEIEGRQPSYGTSTWECDFGANGYRLPTEAEWEKAARGALYDPYRDYPWGDVIDGSMANYSGSGDPFEPGVNPDTTPVGYYNGSQIPAGINMANNYELYDMAGNVVEWTNDRYSAGYYSSSPYDNPLGPASGSNRVLRGGGWQDVVGELWCFYRFDFLPHTTLHSCGFRLVLD